MRSTAHRGADGVSGLLSVLVIVKPAPFSRVLRVPYVPLWLCGRAGRHVENFCCLVRVDNCRCCTACSACLLPRVPFSLD